MTLLILALLIAGLGLLVAEAHLPTYGVLGAAGTGALVAGIVLGVIESGGSLILALALTVPMAAAVVAVGAVAMRKALAVSRQRARCGAEGLIGHVGIVRRPLDPLGHVVVDGELWRARRTWAEEDELPPVEGEAVVVDRVNGLTLSVRRAELWEVGAVTVLLVFLAVLVAVVAALAASSVRILREYERAVVFRLGRLIGQKGPGLILLIPMIDRMVRVDLRTVVLDIPPQDVITRDNVTAKVNAVAYFRVVDAASAIVEVERYLAATSQIAQTTLRSVLGKADLDMLLAERERLNDSLQQIIDEQTDPWGVKVTAVEIKDVEIPSAMQRAMARQAEAERERRAKVIHAEGEFQASQRLRDAAEVISPNPAALQLRYLQTLTEVGVNQNSTIVFPLPLDVIRPFLEGTLAPAAEPSAEEPEPASNGQAAQPAMKR